MQELEIRPFFERIERQVYIADGPIDFATWIDLAQTIDTELVRGVMIERLPTLYAHEDTFGWLLCTFGSFINNRKLGIILGSRTAVKISEIDGRLPDLLFVRADNTDIIHNDAIYGVPDVVIEIISKNDRPSDLIPLEADYRTIGVPEILFIDPKKKRVRYLRKIKTADGTDYDEIYLTTGQLTFAGVPGFAIEVEWLFSDDRPDAYTVTKQLIEGA